MSRAPTWCLLVILLSLQVALHVRYLNLPPIGFHQWRQTMTLSVARNFHEGDMDFFTPRTDYLADSTGIAGMEFPLVNYVIALGYRAFGFSHAIGRGLVLLFSLAAIAGCFLFARRIFGSRLLGFAASLFLISSPLFAYYSITVLPDVPMLAFLLLGLYGLWRWSESPKTGFLVLGIACSTLAALVKMSALAAVPAGALLLWQGLRRAPGPMRLLALAFTTCGLSAVAAWYTYARYLNRVHENEVYALYPRIPYALSVIRPALTKLLFQWLPELFVNYAGLVFLLTGIVAVARTKREPIRPFVVALTLGAVVYVIAFLPMLDRHDYYMVSTLPLLVVLVTAGFRRARAWALGHRPRVFALAALVVVALVLGPVRGFSRLEERGVPEDLATLEGVLDATLPDRTTPIIVADDRSPSIFLYFMHRKGWSVTDAMTGADLQALKSRGAEYLVSNSRELEARPDVARDLREIGSHGRFRIFRLAPSK